MERKINEVSGKIWGEYLQQKIRCVWGVTGHLFDYLIIWLRRSRDWSIVEIDDALRGAGWGHTEASSTIQWHTISSPCMTHHTTASLLEDLQKWPAASWWHKRYTWGSMHFQRYRYFYVFYCTHNVFRGAFVCYHKTSKQMYVQYLPTVSFSANIHREIFTSRYWWFPFNGKCHRGKSVTNRIHVAVMSSDSVMSKWWRYTSNRREE